MSQDNRPRECDRKIGKLPGGKTLYFTWTSRDSKEALGLIPIALSIPVFFWSVEWGMHCIGFSSVLALCWSFYVYD